MGALYSVNDGAGRYRVAKVLAVEPDGVHLSVYRNEFNARPRRLDTPSLCWGTTGGKDGFGIAHLPLSRAAFDKLKPVFVCQASVSEHELRAYRMWREAGGSLW